VQFKKNKSAIDFIF